MGFCRPPAAVPASAGPRGAHPGRHCLPPWESLPCHAPSSCRPPWEGVGLFEALCLGTLSLPAPWGRQGLPANLGCRFFAVPLVGWPGFLPAFSLPWTVASLAGLVRDGCRPSERCRPMGFIVIPLASASAFSLARQGGCRPIFSISPYALSMSLPASRGRHHLEFFTWFSTRRPLWSTTE